MSGGGDDGAEAGGRGGVGMSATTESDTESIVCPHCGKAIADLWDYGWGNDEGIDIECGHCARPIRLTRRVSVDYTAEAM